MDLVQTQHLLAQFNVARHGGEGIVDGGDQAVVHAHRHVAAEEGSVAGTFVLSGIGKEGVELHTAGVHAGEGVDVFFEFAEVGLKGILADPAVLAFPVHAEIAVGQGDLFALFVGDLGEGHIHAFQHVKVVAGDVCGVPQHGQQGFFLFRQGVGTGPGHVFHQEAVEGQFVGGHPGRQGLFRNGKQLGIQEGQGGLHLNVQADTSGLQALVFRRAVVPRLEQEGVNVAKLHLFAGEGNLVQGGLQAFLGIAQGALQGGDLLHQGTCLGVGRFPCRHVGENGGQVPGKLGIHFVSVFQFHNFSFLCLAYPL